MKKMILLIIVTIININAQTVEQIKTSSSLINAAGLISFNNKLILGGNGVLNSSDGTDAGTKALTSSKVGFIFGVDAYGYAKAFNGKLYFAASNGADGTQLWVTDGTVAGTQQFKKFNNSGISLRYFVEYKSKLYFLLDDKVHGLELWCTDGTSANTLMLKDINPNGNGFDYLNLSTAADPSFTIMNDKLYFKANDGTHGLELWVTDGTDAGTQMVKDIYSSGPSGSFNTRGSGRLGIFGVYNNNLYFAANDGDGSGWQMWVSDGTSAGTKKFLGKGNVEFQFASNFTLFNNKLYFFARSQFQDASYNWVDVWGLWCTDGTAAGTTSIKSFGAIDGDNGLSDETKNGSMRIFNGKMYFAAAEPRDSQIHLWVSDGTTAGTTLVTKLNTNGTSFLSSSVTNQTFVSNVFNNKLYFVADDGSGYDLFSTDGTKAGTVKVNSPAHNMYTQQLINTQELVINNGSLYFQANYTGKSDLWIVRGSATDVSESHNDMPLGYSLSQNYPNPFNPSTKISFSIPQSSNVTLKVFNALGEEVSRLVDERKESGSYSVDFNASNLSSGVYFYTLLTNSFVQSKKMILIK